MEIPPGFLPPKIACREIGYKRRQFMNLLNKGVIPGMRVNVPGSQPLWFVHVDALANFAQVNLPRLGKIIDKHRDMHMKHKNFLAKRGVHV
jgi:hypothetical protein